MPDKHDACVQWWAVVAEVGCTALRMPRMPRVIPACMHACTVRAAGWLRPGWHRARST